MTTPSQRQASFDYIRRAPALATVEAWTALAMAAAKRGAGAVHHARVIGRLVQLFLAESKESHEEAFGKAMVFAIEHAMNAGYKEESRGTALDLLESGWKHGELLRQWRNN